MRETSFSCFIDVFQWLVNLRLGERLTTSPLGLFVCLVPRGARIPDEAGKRSTDSLEKPGRPEVSGKTTTGMIEAL